MDGVQAFNEAEEESCKFIIRPREDMLEEGKGVLQSDDDHELVIKIPFTTKVKIKALIIIGGENGTAPKKLKLYNDLANVDFSILEENEPTQVLDVAEDNFLLADSPSPCIEYPLKLSKFQNVGTLTVGIDENYGAENTEVRYIGLKGENLNQQSKAVVTVYESRANLADHKSPMEDHVSKEI